MLPRICAVILLMILSAGLQVRSQELTSSSLWDHNGSIIRLYASGTKRRFLYEVPRQGMIEQGVRPGTILYEGEAVNGTYDGTAFVFNRKCGRQPYHVTGNAAPDSSTVVLRGEVWRFNDATCKLTTTKTDELVFTFIKTDPPVRSPEPVRSSEEKTDEPTSSGSGIFVTSDGYVLTNVHVLGECKSVWVPGSNAQVVATDKSNDLALLKTKLKPTAVATFRSNAKVGEPVFAYGFPLLGLLTSTGNFTVGNITANAGLQDDTKMLQVSAPVQPGNSGGPLLDQFGNVVGVVVAKLNALGVAVATKDLPQNVNFALKATMATSFLETHHISSPALILNETLLPEKIAELARELSTPVLCR